jgi:hypothetical protein
MFLAALVVAGIAVIKVVEGVAALYGPAHVGAVSMPTVSATANIAYELPLPSEVVFGPELRTYSQLAMSLATPRRTAELHSPPARPVSLPPASG